MTAQLLGRMATGAVWTIAMRLSVAVLGFASTLILARLLSPADFGLIVMGTSVLAALDILTSFRFDIALIQNHSATRTDFDSAWTLNLILCAGLAVLLCMAALPASMFFDEPRLGPVIFVLATTALFDGLKNIGIVRFRKDLEFGRDYLFTVTRKLAQVIVAGVLAFWLRNYWALAAGIVAASLTGLVASYVMQPFRPRWDLSRVRQLMVFSKWMMLDSVIFFLRHRAPDVLIGKLAGPASLGVFGMAQELSMIARNAVAAPIDRAMLPGYAQMSGEPQMLRSSYLAVLGMTALVAMPVAVGTASVAPLAVPLLFGSQWLGAVPVLQVMGLASAVSLISAGSGAIFAAIGKPRILVWRGVADVTLLLAFMAMLIPRNGLVGAAWAFLLAAALLLPAKLWLLNSVMGISFVRWLAWIWRPVLAAAAMHVTVVATRSATGVATTPSEAAVQLALAVTVGGACYVAVALGLWLLAGRPDGPERFLLRKWRDLRGPGSGGGAPGESRLPPTARPVRNAVAAQETGAMASGQWRATPGRPVIRQSRF